MTTMDKMEFDTKSLITMVIHVITVCYPCHDMIPLICLLDIIMCVNQGFDEFTLITPCVMARYHLSINERIFYHFNQFLTI